MQIEVDERDLSIIKFALRRFMHAALDRADWYARAETASVGESERFFRDAHDADALLEKIRTLTPEVPR